MNIWRLHIRPGHSQNIDPVQVCINDKIVGIGWRIDKKPATKDKYMKLGEIKYASTAWR